MIPGDIDLTENLDFYVDKKEKSYRNTEDLDIGDNIDDKEYRGGWNSWSGTITSSWHSSNSHSTSIHLSYNLPYNLNDYMNEYILNDNIYYLQEVYSDADLNSTSPYRTSYTTTNPYWSNYISDQYVYIDGNEYIIKYGNKSSELSETDKLFGRKNINNKEKSISEIFGIMPCKVYENTKSFRATSSPKMSEGYNYYFRLRNGMYDIDDPIISIFGEKDDTEENNKVKIPWLTELYEASAIWYDDYINDLEEEKHYLEYLTNYHWLGM